ncbi:MAG: hypothetical protein KF826_04715 [Xanthobacteraceae bacterium]|nr:hypothetical protein [Xanthobacteraceae bacterium]MBX3521919.1 hypothetical protein [Xanthobacteraceae bacterium]MBX3533633.1 hypothetical protein [Xanthobacteraceae bacterium]MBX3548277.1 hypothetical protein [Xanthobacteraceae bacterium]MCW5679205.1 hypothetical protein [Xanthobacteraceae bacterium]
MTTNNGNRNVREERLQVMLRPEEIRAIDDFRFTKRMPSRAAAIRELLRCGLASENCGEAERETRSSDFGVLRSPQNETKNGNGSRDE